MPAADVIVNWATLRQHATQAAGYAHAPYSQLHVGAAGLTDCDRIVTGCNVENASLGLTLCAECGLISDLYRSGGSALLAVCIVDGDGEFLWPCGRCRQLLYEAGGGDVLIDSATGPVRLETLLPNAFGPEDLPTQRAGPGP